MTAAEILRKRLLQRGVRPRDLAKALDVDASMASLMLRGERNIAVWHLDAIAALLGMSVPELFASESGTAAGSAGRDLSRHPGTDDGSQTSHSTQGGRPDGDSATRALQLVSAAYLKFVKAVTKNADDLYEIIDDQRPPGHEARRPRKSSRPARRSHR